LFVPQRFTTKEDQGSIDSAKQSSYKLIDKVFKYLDNHMKGKDHVIADRRTIVDPYAFVMIRWGVLLPNKLEDYPNLSRFVSLMKEDESVKKCMQIHGVQ